MNATQCPRLVRSRYRLRSALQTITELTEDKRVVKVPTGRLTKRGSTMFRGRAQSSIGRKRSALGAATIAVLLGVGTVPVLAATKKLNKVDLQLRVVDACAVVQRSLYGAASSVDFEDDADLAGYVPKIDPILKKFESTLRSLSAADDAQGAVVTALRAEISKERSEFAPVTSLVKRRDLAQARAKFEAVVAKFGPRLSKLNVRIEAVRLGPCAYTSPDFVPGTIDTSTSEGATPANPSGGTATADEAQSAKALDNPARLPALQEYRFDPLDAKEYDQVEASRSLAGYLYADFTSRKVVRISDGFVVGNIAVAGFRADVAPTVRARALDSVRRIGTALEAVNGFEVRTETVSFIDGVYLIRNDMLVEITGPATAGQAGVVALARAFAAASPALDPALAPVTVPSTAPRPAV